MNIISRAEWGARPPKNEPVYVPPGDRYFYVVHHSGGPVTQTVRAIQDWCMDGRGFNDIDYNFLVRGSTGEIYEGRGWDVQGAHTKGYNVSGVGVCIIGTDQATDAAKVAVRWLYGMYNARCGRTLTIRGHRDLDTTDCPGNVNYAWVHAGMPLPLPPKEDLMDQAIFNGLMDKYAERVSGFNGETDTTRRLSRLWSQVVRGDDILAAVEAGRLDPAAVVARVLAGLDPQRIADLVVAALPADQAKRTADELAARLAA